MTRLVNCRDALAIHVAARHGSLEVLQALLDADDTPDKLQLWALDYRGHNPFHLAAQWGSLYSGPISHSSRLVCFLNGQAAITLQVITAL